MSTLTITIFDDTQTFTYPTREQCVSHALFTLKRILDRTPHELNSYFMKCFVDDLKINKQNELHTDYDDDNWYKVHIYIN